MVVPLRDLLDRQIFTHDEIKSIVDRRRQSEYLLRRVAARKADFLRYIEAEQLLERLRQLRARQRRRDHRRTRNSQAQQQGTDDNNNDGRNNDGDLQKHPGDIHIIQHIHLLFTRAIRKFRGDLSLHLAHAEFCKSTQSWTRLGKCYSQAIQVFPHAVGLWIEYASYEFFGPARSVRNARIVLQRGLRMNNKDTTGQQEIWLEYFALEMHYAQTLKGRRQILQLQQRSSSSTTMADTQAGDTIIGFDGKPIVGSQADEDDSEDGVYDDYKIPTIVYKNAIKAVPGDIQFRLRFMDKCKQFPATKVLMDAIVESIITDFGSRKPESWIARALYEAELARQEGQSQDGQQPIKKKRKTTANSSTHNDDNENDVDRVLSILKEAVDTLKSDEMYLQAFRFAKTYKDDVQERCEANYDHDDDDNDESETQKKVEAVARFINELLDIVSDRQYSLCDLALEQTNYFLDNGYPQKAIDTIREFCTTKNSLEEPTNAQVWIRWATLQENLQEQIKVLEKAVLSIPMTQSPDHFVLLLQLFGLQIRAADHASALSTRNVDDDDDDSDSDESRVEAGHDSLFDSLQRLLLLSPKTDDDCFAAAGMIENNDGSPDVGSLDFGSCRFVNVYDAGLAYTNFLNRLDGLAGVRKVYQLVLLRSTVHLSECNADSVQTLFDKCLELETDRVWRLRLYDKAIEVFDGTPLQEMYRSDRNEKAVFAN